MSTVNEELLANEEPRVFFQEAEKLLKLAEDLDEKCQRHDRFLHFSYFLGIMGILIILFMIGVIATLWTNNFGDNIRILLLGVANALVIFFAWFPYRLALKKKFFRERRALSEVVSLLREIEKPIAERDQLSALERAEFRIRLSRFDIGPGSDNKH